eukprot:COSAG02_NODE_2806_length_7991_cov_21.891916_11_plen_229_part_00
MIVVSSTTTRVVAGLRMLAFCTASVFVWVVSRIWTSFQPSILFPIIVPLSVPVPVPLPPTVVSMAVWSSTWRCSVYGPRPIGRRIATSVTASASATAARAHRQTVIVIAAATATTVHKLRAISVSISHVIRWRRQPAAKIGHRLATTSASVAYVSLRLLICCARWLFARVRAQLTFSVCKPAAVTFHTAAGTHPLVTELCLREIEASWRRSVSLSGQISIVHQWYITT